MSRSRCELSESEHGLQSRVRWRRGAQPDDEPGDAFGGAFAPLITLNNIQGLARRQENGEAFGKAIILNRQQEGYASRKIALECVCHGRER